MNMQGTARQQYVAKSGTVYTAGATGVVSSVANGDVVDLLNMGCVPIDSSLNAINIPLWNGRNSDGSVLAAAAAAGKFGQTVTPGTALTLVGEAGQNNTKTSTALWIVPLPQDYTAGANLTVGVDTVIAGTGTAGTKTVDVRAFRIDGQGATGADICATAAQNMATSRATQSFTITGTTLSPGDLLMVEVATVLQETGNSNTITATVNGLSIS